MKISLPRPPLLAALALACGSLVSAQPAGSSGLEACDPELQVQAVVERLNTLRRLGDSPCSRAGAPAQPLAWEQRLADSAHEQALDLARNDRVSHLDARQRGFGTRLRDAGYSARGAGENLAVGQSSLEDALATWLASPAHCANLMRPEYRDVGLACVQRRGSRYERFWVAHLGAPLRP